MKQNLVLIFTTLALAYTIAWGQPVVNPRDIAMACAYNSTPPTSQSGQFVYLQCDGSGHAY